MVEEIYSLHISTNGKVPPHSHINLQRPTIPLFALTKGQRSKRQLSKSFMLVIQPLSTGLIKPNFFFTRRIVLILADRYAQWSLYKNKQVTLLALNWLLYIVPTTK